MDYIWVYIGVISIIGTILTVHDKNAAIKRRWRVKERTLLAISALGGSVAMLITMVVIRHKTKHPKFMVGIPIMILLQAVVMVLVYMWYN